MKTLPLILLSLVLCVSASAKQSPSLKFLNTDYKNILKFKVNKDLVGATINLIYSNGDVVAKEVLLKKRMVIDFCDVKTGAYRVVVEKGGYKEEFEIKKDVQKGVQYGRNIPISG